MNRLLFVAVFFVATSSVSFWSPAHAQMRHLNICVTDYSVGIMPLILAKRNGYFAQEQMEVDLLAARGSLCTMGLIGGSFQATYSPSTFDAVVAGDVKGKVIYVAQKFLLHRLIVAPQIKRFEDLKGKKIAISPFGSLTDLLSREILADHGLRAMQDVLLLQTGGAPVRLAALKSGNVQGALLSSQHALAAMQDGFRNMEYEPPPYVSCRRASCASYLFSESTSEYSTENLGLLCKFFAFI
jgi:NitT/TauT family transport system substrate-binding protein